LLEPDGRLEDLQLALTMRYFISTLKEYPLLWIKGRSIARRVSARHALNPAVAKQKGWNIATSGGWGSSGADSSDYAHSMRASQEPYRIAISQRAPRSQLAYTSTPPPRYRDVR
jgi:hypothetical protein